MTTDKYQPVIELGGHTDEFYAQPKEYIVQAGTLNHLLRMEIVLEQLKKHNVHLWEFYDDAIEAAELEMAQ